MFLVVLWIFFLIGDFISKKVVSLLVKNFLIVMGMLLI